MMRWYYKELGQHTHVRVFMTGVLCGKLCFASEDFARLMDSYPALHLIEFLPDILEGAIEGPQP